MIKKYFWSFVLFFCFLVWSNVAHAGFGISPPYVKTTKPIFLGGHYEQRVTLLRSAADDDLQAKVIINAPEISDWVTIDKGEIFDLPKDQLRVPMVVRIDVPVNAEIGNYQGHINIRVMPKNKKTGGGVAIALGARVDIDITVTDKTFIDYKIRQIEIPNFEILPKPWNSYIFSKLFYKSKVNLQIENTGNVSVAPTKVVLDVLDLSKNNLLESHEDKKIDKVEPFEITRVSADFSTDLEPGQYWGKIKVYNGDTIIRKDELIFTVGEVGEFGGTKMGTLPYLLLISMVLVVIIFVLLLIKVRSWRVLFYFIWPFIFIIKMISKLFRILKIKFWKWMHEKSSQYQNVDTSKRKK